MANEATVRNSMLIRKGPLFYNSQPTSFQNSITIGAGPSPGLVIATVVGTVIDLSKLVSPGLCRISNLDVTRLIKVGLYDTLKFRPIMDVFPNEFYVIKLASLEEEDGPGTGTTGTTDQLMVRAYGANCRVLVEAFDR